MRPAVTDKLTLVERRVTNGSLPSRWSHYIHHKQVCCGKFLSIGTLLLWETRGSLCWLPQFYDWVMKSPIEKIGSAKCMVWEPILGHCVYGRDPDLIVISKKTTLAACFMNYTSYQVEISRNKIILDGAQTLQSTFPAWMASSEIGRSALDRNGLIWVFRRAACIVECFSAFRLSCSLKLRISIWTIKLQFIVDGP